MHIRLQGGPPPSFVCWFLTPLTIDDIDVLYQLHTQINC